MRFELEQPLRQTIAFDRSAAPLSHYETRCPDRGWCRYLRHMRQIGATSVPYSSSLGFCLRLFSRALNRASVPPMTMNANRKNPAAVTSAIPSGVMSLSNPRSISL